MLPSQQAVHLRADGVSVLLDLPPEGLPTVVHWGADLGPLDDAGAAATARAAVPVRTHSGTDVPQPVELVPQGSRGHAGRGGLSGHRTEGGAAPLLVTTSVEVDERGVTVGSADDAAGVALVTEVVLEPQGVLRMRSTLTNTGKSDYDLVGLPVQLPLPHRAQELLDLTGRWSRESVPQRHDLGQGAWVREGRRGRPGHDTPLLLTAGTPGFGFGHGEVWGMHVAWSGDTTVWAERLPEGRVALGGGELLAAGEIRLPPGASYASPWVLAAHSTAGLDGLTSALHDWVRARPSHPRTPRPVVLNTWEAVYFDHDLDRLRALADDAAALGVERFVLDDGWFTGRRHDRAGLGDWDVDTAVWPEGLHPLIEHVRGLGMEFGLWVEPEMVNLDSDLAREHPDWVLAPPGRTPPEWRSQQVLDLAEPDAAAHVLGKLDALLTTYPIAYLKWDHNRDLMDAVHAGRPSVHAQTAAVYDLLDELRRRHPGVEIESCASGGARVDLAVLERTDRIWASDCTDAHERQGIQRWVGLVVPPELVGSHVSAPVNHQTGRTLDLSFRAGTALFGHFGIELDITAVSAEEREELAAWVALYRDLRPLLHGGRTVRADHTEPGSELHGVVSPDGSDALFALVQKEPLLASVPGRVVLPGLDPARAYRLSPQAPGHAPRTLQLADPPWFADGSVTLPGRVLASAGVAVPVLCPHQLLLLRATALPSAGG